MSYSPVRVLAFAMLALLLIVATLSPAAFAHVLALGSLLAGGVGIAIAARPEPSIT